jgi:hypothetical protein
MPSRVAKSAAARRADRILRAIALVTLTRERPPGARVPMSPGELSRLLGLPRSTVYHRLAGARAEIAGFLGLSLDQLGGRPDADRADGLDLSGGPGRAAELAELIADQAAELEAEERQHRNARRRRRKAVARDVEGWA